MTKLRSRSGIISKLTRNGLRLFVTLAFAATVLAQTQTPTPDQRGLGVKSGTSSTSSEADRLSREAKPELVLQTGYNNLFGATRLVFSPDGRLLATGSFRSSSIKLWETATGRELRNLSTGTQGVMGTAPAIAFSPDSRLVAAAAGDNSVRIWDVVTGAEVQSLAGSQGSMASSFGISFIGFTGNGQIVTAADSLKVWDVASGRELRNLGAVEFNAVAFTGTDGGFNLSADGSQLARVVTEDAKPQVKLIEVASGRELRTINLPDKDFVSAQISFASDGRLLVAGVIDKQLKLLDLGGKTGERDLARTQVDFSPIKFSRDGSQVWFVENYAARRWDTNTGQELPGLKLPNTGMVVNQPLSAISLSSDGKKAATGGFDTPTMLWDLETGKQLLKLNGRINMAYKVRFNADGSQLASGGRTRWDLRTGRGLRLTSAPADGVISLPSPDGKLIASYGLSSNTVSIQETPTGRQLLKLVPASSGSVVQRASFSANGAMLIVTYGPDFNKPQASTLQTINSENQTKIWEVKSGRELATLMTGMGANEAGLSFDNRVVATLGSMGAISLWDAGSGSKLRDLSSSPMDKVMGNLANMGMPMPGSGKPGKISRQSMPQMPNAADMSAMITNMMGAMSAGTMGRSVTSLAFSPDGRLLATGGVESKSNFDMAAMMSGAAGGKRPKNQPPTDPTEFMKNMKVETIGQVVLWDIASGQEIGALKGHGKGVTQVAFSRDGRWLASGGSDNTIKIWDVASRTEVRTFKGHTANLESLDFSPDSRLLASASDDGSTFLWDTTTGEHLLTLISLDDGGEWMVVTPQGLFDGTPVSWNQILWRYNQDTFNVAPIEWFFNEFYYPGLLSDIIAGKRPKVAQDVSKKDRRQPIVKVSLPGPAADATAAINSRTVKIKVDVTDAPADKEHAQGSGARDVRLFRNGSLVKVWHGDVLNGKTSISLEEEITVTAGPNRLTAYAFNRDNVKSKDAQLPLTGADSLKRAGTAYIIAVGVNEYSNSAYNLKYAVADAKSFSDEVRLRQSQLGGFERIEVIPLLNESATKANILATLERLAGAPGPPSLKANAPGDIKRVQPEDTVIIYFAGHGTAQEQRFYLIPHDLGYAGDRTKLNEAGLREILAHSISDDELEQAVEGLDAGHLLLVIDACNSGQALEAEEKRRGPMNSKGLAQLAYEKGMYILTAAQSYQAALETEQLGHGLLTYALVEEGLKTPVADGSPADGLVNVREWLDFATDRVPQMQEEKMKQARGFGKEVSFVEGEQTIADPEKRSVQRPRVFYRRELEANPLIVAKP